MAKPSFLPNQPVIYRRHPDGIWNDAEFIESNDSYTLVRRRVPGRPGSSHLVMLSNGVYRIRERGDQPCNQTTHTPQTN